MRLEYDIARLNYIHKICVNCSTERMKNRECGLFKGHSGRNCWHMENAINARKVVKQAKNKINWAKEISEVIKEVNKEAEK